MTQIGLAQKSGVGLRFIRELEQGKESVRLDKVNQVLSLFGHVIAPVTSKQLDPYEILLTYLKKDVRIQLKKKEIVSGTLTAPVFENEQITGWRLKLRSIKKKEATTAGAFDEAMINHADIEEISESLI